MVEDAEALPWRTPHDLRHTYVTLALHCRSPAEVAGKLLGQASVGIILDIHRYVIANEKRTHGVNFGLPSK